MKIADEYFNNCRKIAERTSWLRNRKVRYKCFARENGVLVGSDKAVNFIAENTYAPLRILGLKDGERFAEGKPILIIEGNYNELVTLETTYLGFLSFSGAAAAMREIVEAADGVPVIDMSARHYPWQLIEEIAMAAYLGGAAGTSTQAGHAYVQKWRNPGGKFKLYASLPHAAAAVAAEMAEMSGKGGLYPSVMAAKLFQETFPDKPIITVLVDYEGRELYVAEQAFEVFGEKLFAVRLDTHGGRNMQGTATREDPGAALAFLDGRTGVNMEDFVWNFARDNGLDYDGALKYIAGNGVTAESVFVMRNWLDSIGAAGVKIVVSSGFNKIKTRAFRALNAPMDFIGTGSFVRFSMFTSDISDVWEKGWWRKRVKVGRELENNPDLKILFERE